MTCKKVSAFSVCNKVDSLYITNIRQYNLDCTSSCVLKGYSSNIVIALTDFPIQVSQLSCILSERQKGGVKIVIVIRPANYNYKLSTKLSFYYFVQFLSHRMCKGSFAGILIYTVRYLSQGSKLAVASSEFAT